MAASVAVAPILPAEPAALATIIVQSILVGAAVILGAITARDLWREVRR